MSSERDMVAWDRAADAYIERIGSDGDTFFRRISGFLDHHLGDVAGLEVLDLGCGHGWLAERLRQQGARVVGIDGSSALIAHARRRHPEIDFRVHDLTLGLPPRLPVFERIISHMVLMDLARTDELIADVAAALAPGGVFVFSLLHPSFFGRPPVQDPSTQRWNRAVEGYLGLEQRHIESFGGHTHYHRPLSWYFEQLHQHGLAVVAMDEPRTLPVVDKPESDWTEYERWFSTIPTMIALVCEHRSPAARVGK